MMGVRWVVGDDVPTEAEWAVDGVSVTSGSATVHYWRQNGLVKEYLQSDGVSWGASVHNFPLTLTGNKWRRVLVVPSSADNFTVFEEVRHSDPDLVVFVDGHDVTEVDTDVNIDKPTGIFGPSING